MAVIFSVGLSCWKKYYSINVQISYIFSMARFVMAYLIFNKGLRGETEHRPRQDSWDAVFIYRRKLRKINPKLY